MSLKLKFSKSMNLIETFLSKWDLCLKFSTKLDGTFIFCLNSLTFDGAGDGAGDGSGKLFNPTKMFQ